MKIQKINQSSICQVNNRPDGSVSFSEGYGLKPKSNYGRGDFSMPSFKSRVNSKHAKTLLQEVGSLIADACNSVKESLNKSKTNKILIAPTRKLWGDFKSVAERNVSKMDSAFPKFSPIVKGAALTATAATGFDVVI